MSSWSSFSSQVKQKGRPVDAAAQPSSSSSSQQSFSKKEKGNSLSSSSSFLSLKAEIAERKGTASNAKTGRHENDSIDYLKKSEKKLPAYLRPSPDVLSRSLKHDKKQTTSSWANTPSSQLDAARQALERKVAMYEKLKTGATGGLDEHSLQESLIDWDRKAYQQDGTESGTSSDDDDDDEDDNVGSHEKGPTDSDEDPMTEYEDDLGRMRRVRRSAVPRSAVRSKRKREEEEIDEDMVSYGPSTSFPVYKPDPTSQQQEDRYKRKGVDHFDSQFEKRYRGAGFYQFSQDEETRKKEMEALRRDRVETEKARDDRKEGQSIGERKREERRRLVENKKREIEEKRKRLAEQEEATAETSLVP